MQRSRKIVYNFGIAVAMLFLFCLFGNVNVGALTNIYESGTSQIKRNDNSDVAVEYEYSYKVTFDENDAFSKLISGLAGQTVNAGRKITVKMSDTGWARYDKFKIEKYYLDAGGTALRATDPVYEGVVSGNSDELKILEKDGLYKITYTLENDGVIEQTNVEYVYILNDMYKAELIIDDSKYENMPVIGQFEFSLDLEDSDDLSNYSYYYRFSHVEFENSENITSLIIDDAEKGSGMHKLNKKILLPISNQMYHNSSVYFLLYIESSDGSTGIKTIFSDNKYLVKKEVEANVFLLDNEGNKIEKESAEINYYKKGDTIKFLVEFNHPVKYSGFEYSLGTYQSVEVEDAEIPVSNVLLEYTVGEEIIVRKDETLSISVSQMLANEISVECKVLLSEVAGFVIDSKSPEIDNWGEEVSTFFREKDFYLQIVDDSEITKVSYYFGKCNNAHEGVCHDEFDETNELIREAIYETEKYKVSFDDHFGKYDLVQLTLFVKVEDELGNIKYDSKQGYPVDNVIIPDDKKADLIKTEEIKEGETVVGKKLFLDVGESNYNLSSVRYEYDEEAKDCSKEGTTYVCVSVSHDVILNGVVRLTDLLGNVEEYPAPFKFSTLQEESFDQSDLTFNVYNDRDYSIGTELYNVMTGTEKVSFNSELLAKLQEKLKVTNNASEDSLKMSLVVFGEEAQEIKLLENISSSLTLPTTLEIFEKVKGLEEYKTCALKDNSCDLKVYLKISYADKNFANMPQERYVLFNLLDNSLKYKFNETFESVKEVNVNSSYKMHTYSFYDSVGAKIGSNLVTEQKTIKYTNLSGVTKTVTTIDTSKLGTYVVSMSYTANGSSSFPLEYTVIVKDSEAPVIKVEGDKNITIKVGEEFDVNSIVSVSDNYDKEVELVATWKDGVELDVTKEGKYVVTFTAVDSNGNEAEAVTITIEVSKKVDFKKYIIIGGIALGVILIIVFAVSMDSRRKNRRNGGSNSSNDGW